MKPLNIFTFQVSFTLLNIENFENIDNYAKKEPNIDQRFKYKIGLENIELEIPSGISGYLSSMDNEGERIILNILLDCLGCVLEKHKLENTLTKEVIERIIDEKLPLGLKKMLLFINSKYSVQLDPSNLSTKRLIQESRKQIFLDKIIPLIGASCPPEGNIERKPDKQKFAKTIVFALLDHLKNILKDYNSLQVLFELMKNYEALLHHNALSRLRTPARLHCFKEEENIVEEIQKQIEITDETSLVQRCLIEHLSAEPSFGQKPITQQLIDDIIAIMSLVIWWGGIGDSIRYELFNVELSVLPSRRIGTNSRQITEQFFNQFTQLIIEEYIEETVDNFSSNFGEDNIEKKSVPVGFNKAFEKEVGITFEKLGGIVNLLVEIGFEQNTSIANLTIPEIVNEVKNSFDETFIDEEIQDGLKFLSLWNSVY